MDTRPRPGGAVRGGRSDSSPSERWVLYEKRRCAARWGAGARRIFDRGDGAVNVLAVILACSLDPDDALVRALVEIQNEGNVYFVGDTSTLQSKDELTSVEDALRVADGIRAHGVVPQWDYSAYPRLGGAL